MVQVEPNLIGAWDHSQNGWRREQPDSTLTAHVESVLFPPADPTFGESSPPVGAAAPPFLFAHSPTPQPSRSSSVLLCVFPVLSETRCRS
jgi:hypothetical protein